MSRTGSERGAIARLLGGRLLAYLLIVEALFATLLVTVLVGSGKVTLGAALQKALLLCAFFVLADVAIVVLVSTGALAFAQVLFPIQKNHYEGIHRRAQALAANKQFSDAVDLYESWIDVHPRDVEARFELARMLRGPMRRPTKAVEALTAILDAQPMQTWMVKTLEELADLYRADLKDRRRAAAMYKVIASYYPNTPDAARAAKFAEMLDA